jgi:hypothetical protein
VKPGGRRGGAWARIAATTAALAALLAAPLVGHAAGSVLQVHHPQDACPICAPRDLPLIVQGLARAPVKKLLLLSGGGPPSGDVCEALHHHGFIGVEAEAVDAITGWIARPSP